MVRGSRFDLGRACLAGRPVDAGNARQTARGKWGKRGVEGGALIPLGLLLPFLRFDWMIVPALQGLKLRK